MTDQFRTINLDDEIGISAEQRGHTYADGDVIVGKFELGPEYESDLKYTPTLTVRFRTYRDGSSSYYDASGDSISTHMVLTAWRYATDEEIDAFELQEEAAEDERMSS